MNKFYRISNGIIRNQKATANLLQQVRFIPKWAHRRPVKVYTQDEFDAAAEIPGRNTKQRHVPSESSEQSNDVVEFQEKPRRKKHHMKPLVATNQITNKHKPAQTDMLDTVINADGEFIYTKLKDNDNKIGVILTQLKNRKQMEKNDLILLEGKRLIKDALQAKCKLKYLLFSRKPDVVDLVPYLPKLGAKICKMPYREIQMWSDLTTSPGIMGIFQTPDTENFRLKQKVPITLVCDNIREPGNLGAILRICAGVGCENVILTKGCVHVWDPKVLRSASGAHFKLKMKQNVDWEDIEEKYRNRGVFIADNRIISDTTQAVYDSPVASGSEADSEAASEETPFDLEQALRDIPLLPYYSVDYKACGSVLLIVGGETHGISSSSYEVASKLNGVRLNIPLSNGVESMNVGAALGIIVFEMKKQFLTAATPSDSTVTPSDGTVAPSDSTLEV